MLLLFQKDPDPVARAARCFDYHRRIGVHVSGAVMRKLIQDSLR
jgi:hypothetical protein